MNLRTSIFFLAWVGVGAMASAQSQGPGHYFERPGINEFSGELIVRPLQPEMLAKRGMTALEQSFVLNRARSRVSQLAREYVPATDEFIVTVPSGTNENSLSLSLMATGDYQYAEPNWICYPTRNPNDPQFGQQWHHTTVKSRQAWDLVYKSALPQIVAVVDTGIDINHPDLKANRVPGYNSVDRKAEADGGQVNDINGHGTHVAGDAAAIGNNSTGVVGMGWNFKIMMVRTSNDSSGGAALDDIMAGARWAAEHGAKTVSASYSGVDASTVGTTGTYIKSINALFCYAAGNDGRDLSGFSYPDTIVVGASDQNDARAGFSAYGRGVHVFAPGVDILSTTLGGGYGGASGTSMATPVANGCLALIFAANPTLKAAEVQSILEANCDNIGPSAIFGHGRVNQYKNVVAALARLGKDAPVRSVTTTYGTWLSGGLSNIVNPNTGGQTYDVMSTPIVRVGQIAGVEMTYTVPANPAKLISLEFVNQAAADPGTLVSGFVFAWNFQTGAYESLGAFPLKTTQTTQTKKVTSNMARFIGTNGLVKVLFRPVSATSGGGAPPYAFTLRLGHSKVKYAATP